MPHCRERPTLGSTPCIDQAYWAQGEKDDAEVDMKKRPCRPAAWTADKAMTMLAAIIWAAP
jgi:hypothetical protein